MKLNKKIVSLQALKKKLPFYRKRGKKIAFTNGCFDILHYGHVYYLEKAKKDNRILIVGLNSDSSVRSIKGPQRPINPQQYRAALLAALSCIDFVIIFNELTPHKVIGNIKPDILIKGADWKGKDVVGRDTVLKYGGRVEFISYIPNQSTTKILEKITKRCAKS